MRSCRLTILLTLLSTSINVIAHDVEPVHGCTEPYYDIDYHDEAALERLAIELTAFSDCLKAFMERQVEQTMIHQNAATNGLDSLAGIQTKLREKAPKDVLEKAGFDYEE